MRCNRIRSVAALRRDTTKILKLVKRKEHQVAKVRKLNQESEANGTVSAPVSAPVAETPKQVATVTVPNAMSRYMQPAAPVVAAVADFGNYVGFLEDKSGNKQSMNDAGISVGDIYCVADGEIIKLDPMEYHLLSLSQFYTVMATDGSIVKAFRDADAAPENAAEHIVAVLLVKHDGRLIPATGNFRSAKTAAVHPLHRAVLASVEPDFASKSDAHRIAAACPVPAGRVVGKVTTSLATSKKNGNRYYRANCNVRPSTVSDIEALGNAMSDPKFLESLEAVTDAYDSKVAELQKKL